MIPIVKPVMEDEEIKTLKNIRPYCIIMGITHEGFGKTNLEKLKKFMDDKPVMIDVRGMFDEEEAKKRGFIIKLSNFR